ncbi:MAG: hypothetical protein QNJ15_13250 [Erythrobacter sp.]|nr:hypothetical protein [Erythrobacter sp.]
MVKRTPGAKSVAPKAVEIDVEEFAKMQQNIASMEKRISELLSANALQYSIDTGVEKLGEVAKSLHEILPAQGQMSKSLELIAGKIPEGPNYREPDGKQTRLLDAIAGFHPMFDLDRELDEASDQANTASSSALTGDKK